VDFSLVPKKYRQVVANSFPIEIAGHKPGDRDWYALIFHHATRTFENRRLRRGETLDIGEVVKQSGF